MRKYIDAELKVVRLGNDIIATSLGTGDDYTSGNYSGKSAGRRDMFDDSYDEF